MRYCWNRFGPMFAVEIRTRRVGAMRSSRWRWHLDEVIMKINGKTHYLWRPVDKDGKTPDTNVTKTRDKPAALRFLRKLVKWRRPPEEIVTDRLRTCSAVMKELRPSRHQSEGRWITNRVENSHKPFRQPERAMLRFRRMRCAKKFASVLVSVHNHFNLPRGLSSRTIY